jgi:regulator of cell morphogenesis and NO signaling
MQITARTTVAEIAAAEPSTIKLFQRHKIDFCCGGKIPLADACARQGLDTDALLAELRAVRAAADDPAGWGRAPLKDLIGHIQARYHVPLRDELPRLSAMLAKVVQRHGDRLPAALLPLQATFESLHRELVEHMSKEDTVLFPAVLALEANAAAEGTLKDWTWIAQPIDVMEAEHDAAGAALARMRALTGGYAPPEDACPTFRGLYFGLAELERDMHLHVHLENHVLFPRAEQLAVARSVDKEPRRVNESRVGA